MLLLLCAYTREPIAGYSASQRTINRKMVEIIRKFPPAEVIVFHGDWCADCQSEVPVLNRLLAKLPDLAVTDVSLDRSKRDDAGLAALYDVGEIPMVVVKDGGRECSMYRDSSRWEDKLLDCLLTLHSLTADDIDDIMYHGFDADE